MISADSPRDVVKRLARGSGLSILIKSANALLAYLMLLVIARASTAEAYGVFAAALSVAVSASYIASLGQPRAMMRYWTQWTAQDQPQKARAVLRATIILTATGLGAAAFLILAGGALNAVKEMPWSFSVAAGTALYAMAFGWAEYASAALRAQGYIFTAMAPRDIAWRVLVCVIFGLGALAGISFPAETIILLAGGSLFVVISPQILMLCRTAKGARAQALKEDDREKVKRYCRIMWASTAADLAKNYAGVLIVSTFLGAEAAGGYFASDRTANLLIFLLMAMTLVAGPQISHHYHSGRRDLVRLIVGWAGLSSGLVALAGLGFFFLFGDQVLSLFNPAYSKYLSSLLVLCFGQLFAAIAGPAGIVLVISGHERVNLVVTVCVGIGSIVLQALGGYFWGVIGVACAAATGTMFLNVFFVTYLWRKLRIDSTGLSPAVQGSIKLFQLAARAFWPKY